MKQGWMQTLGGLLVLTIIPVLTVLCLSPDFHEWVRTSIAAHFRGESAPAQAGDDASERIKYYHLPEAISKMAEVSEEEPNPVKSASSSSSGFSRAILRLQRALRAYPSWNTRDVFRAVNRAESAAKAVPCPFERINGEQSVLLTQGAGSVPLTETLNHCAAAVEQMTGRERPN